MAACLKTWESCLALCNLLQIVDTTILLSYPHHYHFQSSLYDNQHTPITITADQQFSAKNRRSSEQAAIVLRLEVFFVKLAGVEGLNCCQHFNWEEIQPSAAGAKKYDHQQGELRISLSISIMGSRARSKSNIRSSRAVLCRQRQQRFDV